MTTLNRGNLLLNADGAPGATGAILSVPALALGADNALTPGESFTQVFEIGLNSRRSFSFFVDIFGIPSVNRSRLLLSNQRGFGFEISAAQLSSGIVHMPLMLQ